MSRENKLVQRDDEIEAFAYVEYGKLLHQALIVRRLFDAAGAPYPGPLARLGQAEPSLLTDPERKDEHDPR